MAQTTEIRVLNTLEAQRAVAEAPSERRMEVYCERVMEPLRDYWVGMTPRMKGWFSKGEDDDRSDAEIMTAMFLFDPEFDAGEYTAALERLESVGAWGKVEESLARSFAAFEDEGRSIPVDEIEAIFLLANSSDSNFMESGKGLTGAQGDGRITVLIWPNDYNITRFPATVAHELHHIVRLDHEPWTMETSVGQYMVLEGLAESFAKSLYGEEGLGPWVTGLSDDEAERSREVIGGALDVTGFDKIRGYIFGDFAADATGYEKTGLPYCAGYDIGYRVVQAYLESSGDSVVQATFKPHEEIISRSRYFEDVT